MHSEKPYNLRRANDIENGPLVVVLSGLGTAPHESRIRAFSAIALQKGGVLKNIYVSSVEPRVWRSALKCDFAPEH